MKHLESIQVINDLISKAKVEIETSEKQIVRARKRIQSLKDKIMGLEEGRDVLEKDNV